MQPEIPFYRKMTPFCIIHRNSNFQIFTKTRSHITWAFQRILFFEFSIIFFYFFRPEKVLSIHLLVACATLCYATGRVHLDWCVANERLPISFSY